MNMMLRNGFLETESQAQKQDEPPPSPGSGPPVGCVHSGPDPVEDKLVPGVDHQDIIVLEPEDAEPQSLSQA